SDRGAGRAQCSRHEGAGTKPALEALDLRRGHSHSGSPFFSSTFRGYRPRSMFLLVHSQTWWRCTRALMRPGAEVDQCCGLARKAAFAAAVRWSVTLIGCGDVVVVVAAGRGSVTAMVCGEAVETAPVVGSVALAVSVSVATG